MSRTYKDRHKRTWRKNQVCWRCNKGKLTYCECSGCRKRNKNSLVCPTCNWTNF